MVLVRVGIKLPAGQPAATAATACSPAAAQAPAAEEVKPEVAATALERVERFERRKSQMPQKTGEPWSEDEDRKLLAAFDAGRALQELAAAHERTMGAVIAEVRVSADGRTWRRSLRAGCGYLGGNPPELHFGLGTVERVDELVVRWPSGRETRHTDVPLDARTRIVEPER